ncbi:hypothetical protein BO83DRAFT_428176 [Aspergillus eucalypticola CBS 122712]|uniref:Uncharacterized protein n=1 Tax=Aspergillus eucalypticola (strain CBS 122712 / IBT 29274) TaxID=1448314 RepID=A0A317VBA7_ASPEC|nr:uncharacterized protein BO83DRAFT_428176 [Aspergillus eucalypticola CBS 122712]PWY70669.1 hypothetical protein BO83DRAFT_428176 [Aspergillus eucalypticola CBS 122712]
MFRIFNYAHTHPSTLPPSHHRTPSPIPSVRVEIPPSELLPGLTHNDLPLLGPRPSSSMLEYHQLPILRHLEWRTDETTNEPLRRPLKDVVSLTAAFAQTRGCEPPEPGSDVEYYISRDEERDLGPMIIKSERNDVLTYSPGTSRLDGSILPFPLGPETIDDLPFLRRAVTEMEMHLGTLRRRVRQLEDRERMRDSSINPWELV